MKQYTIIRGKINQTKIRSGQTMQDKTIQDNII